MNQKNPFEYIASINNKEYILSDNDYKEYNPFIVNRGLSLFEDTILYAHEMNKNSHIDKKMQYDYLFYSIRKKKRWTPWPKKSNNSEILDIVKELYGYNDMKAKDALKILTEEQISELKNKIKGVKNDKRST